MGLIHGAMLLLIAALATAFFGPQAQSQNADRNAALLQASRQVEALVQAGSYPEAAQQAELLVQQFPERHEAWLTLANCHLQDGWPMRRDTRVEQAAGKARELAGDRPEILWALNVARFRLRRPGVLEDTRALLDDPSVVMRAPQKAELFFICAELYLERGGDEALVKATEDLGKALTLNPRHLAGLLLRAKLLRQSGQLTQALQDVEAGFKLNPGSRFVHHQFVACYRALRDQEKMNRHREVWRLLTRLAEASAAEHPDDAELLAMLQRLRELNPLDVRRRLDLLRQELICGDLQRAIVEYEGLKQRHPEWQALKKVGVQVEARKQAAKDGGEGNDGKSDDGNSQNPDGGATHR